MGVGLSCSCFGQSSEYAGEMFPNSSVSGKENCSLASTMLSLVTKPRCLWTDKDGRAEFYPTRTEQEEGRDKSKRTLEDWLMESSPTSNYSRTNGNSHAFVHFTSKKVHPSAVDPRDSFSGERLVKVGEDANNCEVISSSFKRNQGGKMKKVSFRLPEKDEIVIFTSPEPTEDGDESCY